MLCFIGGVCFGVAGGMQVGLSRVRQAHSDALKMSAAVNEMQNSFNTVLEVNRRDQASIKIIEEASKEEQATIHKLLDALRACHGESGSK